MKGGMQYFSQVFTAISSIFGIVILLLIGAIVLFLAQEALSMEGTTFGYFLYEKPQAEAVLLTYLDSTYEGERMSNILAKAVYEDDFKIAFKASKEILDKFVTTYRISMLDGTGTSQELFFVGSMNRRSEYAETIVAVNGKTYLLRLQVGE